MMYCLQWWTFKPDEIFRQHKIDDDLLYKHTLKLSEYDFVK
jgi:hypothetical protein